jgi:hypothetical protein
LKAADSETWCGLHVIDLLIGTCVEWFRIDCQVCRVRSAHAFGAQELDEKRMKWLHRWVTENDFLDFVGMGAWARASISSSSQGAGQLSYLNYHHG